MMLGMTQSSSDLVKCPVPEGSHFNNSEDEGRTAK